MEFDENGQNHGKVMEFYFPEKKKEEKIIKMTVAVWLKIKRLENESKRSEKGHGFFIIWSWKVMEKS